MAQDADPDDTFSDICMHLLTLRATEEFPRTLLREKKKGEWVLVADLCRESRIGNVEASPSLFVTWLPDPFNEDGFVVITFYDSDSMRSFASCHNSARLLDE